jgi:peptide/nickel transport system permease protein
VAWYGTKNQYHRWISGFLKGDFGISYLDNRPVASKIWDALRWTLTINLISLLVSYILAIFLGVWSAVRKGTKADQIVTTALFVLYSLPSFWIGTMLIVFFTSPEYGMNLFPPGQVTSLPIDAPFWQRFVDIGYHLTLPIICISYGSLAFISRQMRGGMLSILQQDYIRTARAKGLSEKQVIWRHAFRNSLFPIITLFASIFPATIAGSIVIEVIYSIPGMGMLSLGAINARDWPVVFTVLLLAAILTMLGNLVADLLYAFVDPRVSFDKK